MKLLIFISICGYVLSAPSPSLRRKAHPVPQLPSRFHPPPSTSQAISSEPSAHSSQNTPAQVEPAILSANSIFLHRNTPSEYSSAPRPSSLYGPPSLEVAEEEPSANAYSDLNAPVEVEAHPATHNEENANSLPNDIRGSSDETGDDSIEIMRTFYMFDAPQFSRPEEPEPHIPQAKIHYNIIFLRSPEVPSPSPIVVPPPQQKSIIYVLTKNIEESREVIEIPDGPAQDPQVYFVNYNNDGEDITLPGGFSLKESLSNASLKQGSVLPAETDVGAPSPPPIDEQNAPSTLNGRQSVLNEKNGETSYNGPYSE